MGMRDEIFQQPAVLANLIDNQWENIVRITRNIQEKTFSYLLIAARGTSDNAGLYGKYLFGIHNRKPVALAAPSIFNQYESPPNLENSLVVGISQSGMSPDIVNVLAEGEKQKVNTLAITNTLDSPLANTANYVIDIQAGLENSVGATKTYTAELMSLALLSLALKYDKRMFNEVARTPKFIEEILQLEPLVKEVAKQFISMERAAILGRGFNYSTAFEWALKLKELCYTTAEPYSPADFLHGPVAMVEKDFPILAIAPRGKVFLEMLQTLQLLKTKKKAKLFVVSNMEETSFLTDFYIKIPAEIPEWTSPIVCVVIGQLFSYWLAIFRGLDADNPRGLSKVTLTE